MERISKFIEELFVKLNELKNLHGYEAPIDNPAGLPYKIEFKDNNPYSENWTTLFFKSDKRDRFLGRFVNPKSKIWKDYVSYLRNNTVHYIPERCYSRPSKLSEHLSLDDIRATYSRFLSDNSISFPPPTKNKKYYEITYQRAFKLPMFGATTSDYDDALPDMDCVKQFHSLPYHTSADLHGVYHQIMEDIQALKNTSSIYLHYPRGYHLSSGSLDVPPHVGINTSSSGSLSDSDVDVYSIPIPVKGGVKTASILTTQRNRTTKIVNSPPLKKKKQTLGNNCACTNTQIGEENNRIDYPEEGEVIPDYANTIDWSEFIENQDDFEIDRFWDNYRQGKKVNSSRRYEEILNEVKTEDNTMKRTSGFIRLYINRLGRMPTVNEAEEEYVTRGLNRNSERSTANRRSRFRGCIDYYSEKYDDNRTGFKLNWSEEKTGTLSLISSCVPGNMSYRQGKQIKNIAPEDIGFVYHIICRMENADQNIVLANSLSYSQADELFLAEFGKKCGRHRFSGIIKILLRCSLIEKVRNYKVGLRGNCYRAKRNIGEGT